MYVCKHVCVCMHVYMYLSIYLNWFYVKIVHLNDVDLCISSNMLAFQLFCYGGKSTLCIPCANNWSIQRLILYELFLPFVHFFVEYHAPISNLSVYICEGFSFSDWSMIYKDLYFQSLQTSVEEGAKHIYNRIRGTQYESLLVAYFIPNSK